MQHLISSSGVDPADRFPARLDEEELANARKEAAINCRNGKVAGVLFIAGGVAGTPAIALGGHPPAVFLLTALALVSGAICLLVPWSRLSANWFHLVIAVASLEVFAVATVVMPEFCWYYALIMVYAAYVFSRRWEVAAQVGFAGALMLTLAALRGGEEVVYMLIAVPALLTTTVLVWTLREQLEVRQASYRMLSRRDPLTGVGNYRELQDTLATEVSRHRRTQRRFALVVLDLNNFKQINDLHGHLEGDRVLREVAVQLADTVRRGELVARHGGDEFSIVAPETSEGEAAELASRLAQAVARLIVPSGSVSAQTGWAVYPDHGEDSDSLIAHADRALRSEKRARRALSVEAALAEPAEVS